jgi:FkbM family methyltransferase
MLGESAAAAQLRAEQTFPRLADPWSRSLVLYGAGSIARLILPRLRRAGIEPFAFCDRNPRLWGTSIDGLAVTSPEEAAAKFGARSAVVMTVFNHAAAYAEIGEYLTGLGFRRAIPCLTLLWKYGADLLPLFALDLPQKLVVQRREIAAAAAMWSDEASRAEYWAQIRWRLQGGLKDRRPPVADQYFPSDLFALDDREVFVDCGAFDGDTLRDFTARRLGRFGHVYALEPDPATFPRLCAATDALTLRWGDEFRRRVTLLQLAAGETAGWIRFAALGNESSAISPSGELRVDCRPLDEVLVGVEPTYLKFDIEGAERAALAGVQNTVRRARPILAVCVYHRPDDLWQIPLWLRDALEGYHFHLRRHTEESFESVCYAVPHERALQTGAGAAGDRGPDAMPHDSPAAAPAGPIPITRHAA